MTAVHSADDCWDMFLDIINDGITKFVPKVRRKNGTKPVSDPALKKLVKKKSCGEKITLVEKK